MGGFDLNEFKAKTTRLQTRQILEQTMFKNVFGTQMGYGLARGPFLTHDTLAHKSISNCFSMNYKAQHPRLTVRAQINPQIFLMSLNWIRAYNNPKYSPTVPYMSA